MSLSVERIYIFQFLRNEKIVQPVELTQSQDRMVLQGQDWGSLLPEEVLHHPMGLEALDFPLFQPGSHTLRQEGLVWLLGEVW